MAAGEHHHHQRRADGQRRNHPCSGPNAGASHSENKEESSNEFYYVFVHKIRFYQLDLQLAITNDSSEPGLEFCSGRRVACEGQSNRHPPEADHRGAVRRLLVDCSGANARQGCGNIIQTLSPVRSYFFVRLNESEFQATAEAETIALNAFADVEVMNPAGAKVEIALT